MFLRKAIVPRQRLLLGLCHQWGPGIVNKEALEPQERSPRASQLLIDSTHFLHDSFWKTNKENHTDMLLSSVNSEDIQVRVVNEGL